MKNIIAYSVTAKLVRTRYAKCHRNLFPSGFLSEIRRIQSGALGYIKHLRMTSDIPQPGMSNVVFLSPEEFETARDEIAAYSNRLNAEVERVIARMESNPAMCKDFQMPEPDEIRRSTFLQEIVRTWLDDDANSTLFAAIDDVEALREFLIARIRAASPTTVARVAQYLHENTTI